MISLTGNKRLVSLLSRGKKASGFTFFEIMVAVAVLAVGIVGIYQAFFISLDYVQHVSLRLYANILLDNKASELQKGFRTSGALSFEEILREEKITVNNRPVDFSFGIDLKNVDDLKQVFQADLKVYWLERNHSVSLARSLFIGL